MEFDPEFLFESLEGCEKLETLTLVKVDLKGEFKRKVYLPSLRRFSLSRFNWDVKATSPEELMASISFYTDAAALQTWNTSSVYTSGAEVTLEDDFNFRLFFNGIMLDVENFPGGDLTKYFHPYSQLSLYSTVWNVSNTLGLNLTYVYLRNVDLINWNQPQFPHLTSLTLKVTSEPKLTLDLSLLPTQTLKELVLENINLISTSTFEALEKLTLSRLCFSNTTQALFASRNLKDLRLWDLECDSGEIEVSTFLKSCGGLERLTLQALRSFDPADLESSRESLKDLHLDGVGVVSQSEVFQFRQLDELLLRGKVSFSSPQLFSTTFKLTEVMEFHGFTFEPGFLKEVLKTRVNKIKIHSGREIQLGAEVETFLAQARVPAHLYFRDVSYSLQKRNQTWEYNEDDDTPDVSMARDRDVIMYAYTLSLLSISSLGILGNVLSGGVLSRKRMRSSTSFILLGLTLSDLTLLITYLPAIVYYGLKLIMIFLKYRATEEFGFAYWFLRTKIKQLDVGRFEQQQAVFFYPLNKTGRQLLNYWRVMIYIRYIYIFLLHICSSLAYTGSVYATVLLTLERYVAVCWPLKARLWLRPQRAALITLAVLLFAVLLNLPRWFEGYGSLKTVGQHSFDGKQGAIWKFNRTSDASNVLLQESYRKYYHGWVWLTLMYALPIPLLTFLNYKIWTEVSFKFLPKCRQGAAK